MLIECPECALQISDKAHKCPHCGYPLRPYTSSRSKTRTNKRMRLPNGFGQITEIKGKNLRKPFRAMVTVGKTEKGRPVCRLLKPEAYFSTYNDAYFALMEYNKNPYDLDDVVTVKELYERWSQDYFAKLKSDSSKRTITSAWVYCNSIYSMRARDVRARHIKGCMDSADSVNIKFRIKSLFNLMLDYAVEYEITDRNYARTFTLSSDDVDERDKNKKEHIALTEDELKILWNNSDNEIVSWILLQCFSGWRPKELCNLKLADVDLEVGTMKGGMKTKAGFNRIVPIHPSVDALVRRMYATSESRGSEYLLSLTDSTRVTYDMYNKRFMKVKSDLKLHEDHRPHDPRKTFVTLAKKYNVDEYAIKRMVGHAINDITEDTYTERDTEWLKNEIKKIKA